MGSSVKLFSFEYQKVSLVDHDELQQYVVRLQQEVERVSSTRLSEYETNYASINLPRDKKNIECVKKVIAQKKKLEPSVMVVVGIGGSNLGTIAVQEALFGRFYNEHIPETKVYFADTVDTDYLWDIVLLVEQELEAGKNILLNVVSKSGTTTETIANFELFLELLKRYKKEDWYEHVVVTTDQGSMLWKWAVEYNVIVLAIPKIVGGRYSVFSAVGLFPLGMMNVAIEQLCTGAESVIDSCIGAGDTNIAAVRAVLLFAQYKKNIPIHDLFLFSVDLKSIGRWYRQLMAESLGKDGKGLMPTISIGSTDLHSMAQLYLGGPNNRFTTFVTIEKSKSNIVLPTFDDFEKLVANIQGIPVSSIMQAIFNSVYTVYKKQQLPFCSITLPEKSAFYVGQLLQTMMMEIMYLGFLFGVNPFDQPHVQLYKKETRKLLAER